MAYEPNNNQQQPNVPYQNGYYGNGQQQAPGFGMPMPGQQQPGYGPNPYYNQPQGYRPGFNEAPPTPENSFITTDVPDVNQARIDTRHRRVFWVLIGVIVVLAAFVIWEIVDLIL